MKLGEFIGEYLKTHGISQRAFAKRCGLSHGYMAMTVKGINPRSDTPIVPTLRSLNCIARGMGMSLDELIAQIDDTIVELNEDAPENKTEVFVQLFQQLNDAQQSMIIASMRGILSNDD